MEKTFLASSVEPARKVARPQRRNRCMVGPHRRSFKRLAKFSMSQRDMETCVLVPKRTVEKWRVLLDLRGSCKQGEDGSINTSMEGCPGGPDSSLPPLLLLLLHTFTAHNHLPETRHDPWEREGWNQVHWNWISEDAKKWKLEIKINFYFLI